jgi:eukaryotic-like serine/threonine-protein kinase
MSPAPSYISRPNGQVAQLVEQRTENPRVGGSIPSLAIGCNSASPLRGRLRRERTLPIGDALQITREVADALGHAHRQGIIHRDSKPENILLSQGHALVADFGGARGVQTSGGEHLTETGSSVGTPQKAYMSPEQSMGDSALDGRSDLYRLGCVRYEMLTGEAPYRGPSAQAIIAKRLLDPVPLASRLRETIPPALDRALQRVLAEAPADRFASAVEFARALAPPLSPAAPVSTTPPPAAPAARARRPVQRRLTLGLGALVALAPGLEGRR